MAKHSSIPPQDPDFSAIGDMASTIGSVGGGYTPQGEPVKLTRKEKRQAKKQLKQAKKAADAERRAIEKEYKAKKSKRDSLMKQMKQSEKELSSRTRELRKKRTNANNVNQFIGYERMFENGICEVEPGLFSMSINFPDISYQSAREDKQKDIFQTICQMLDYFGADMLVQWNVVNSQILDEEIGNREFFNVKMQPNEPLRNHAREFNGVLNEKMKEGVSNIKRERYITVTCEAADIEGAIPILARVRNDIKGSFQKINCQADVMDGEQRLELLSSILRPGVPFKFNYDSDLSSHSTLTTKDYIAPCCIDFKPGDPADNEATCFKMDDKWCQVLVMNKFGSELSDRVLSDIVDLPIPMNVSWFVQAMDKAAAVNYVKTRSAWIDKEIIEEQRKAASKGYDFTIISPELRFSKDECLDMLDHLQSKNQRLFEFTGLIFTYADSRKELDEQVMQIFSTARRNAIELSMLDYRQREGLNSILPLGHNHVEISRMFTTAQAGIFLPFATQELDQAGGNYYGQNKNSNNLIFCNRKKLASPVAFVAGKTGSGKSFFVKQEILSTILNNVSDQIIIFDRAAEYVLLCNENSGTTINFGVDSDTYMNPFDMSTLANKSFDSQIAFKIDAMLAQAAASAAESGAGGIDEGEQSIITRSVELAFKKAFDEGRETPLLEDFYNILKSQPEPQAANIALRYERFISGSMGFFNNPSNVDWSNRIIDINIKELPDSMLVFTLINMCEAARNQMYANFEKGKRTWIYIEEIQSLFRYPTVLNYFSRFANEARKFGGLITGITQNSIAMLENENARNIVLNADFIALLKQSPLDRQAWTDLLGLSAQESSFVDETCDKGCGLLIAGSARVPFVGNFPKNSDLYTLFSTDPNDVEEAQIKADLARNKQRQEELAREKEHHIDIGFPKSKSSNDINTTSIEELELSKRVERALINNGSVETLFDLESQTKASLENIKGFGRNGMIELREALQDYLSIRKDLDQSEIDRIELIISYCPAGGEGSEEGLSNEEANLNLRDDLDMPARHVNKLNAVGIMIVNDLVGKSKDDLLAMSGIGKACVGALIEALQEAEIHGVLGL